jgi:hypothetical protein
MTQQENAVDSVKAKSSRRKGLSFTREELIELHWVRGLSRAEIGRMFGVTGTTILYWCKKLNVEPRAKLQEILFIPSPALSYVFGVIHGDGCVYYRPEKSRYTLRLSVTDLPFAESFARALRHLGLHAHTIPIKCPPPWQPQYLTSSDCRSFCEQCHQMTLEQQLDLGYKFPREYIRGYYESEGTVKWRRTSLELAIYNTNSIKQRRLMDALVAEGLHPKWYEVPRQPFEPHIYVQLFQNLEIRKFMAWIMPCIKYQPRRDANAEPSQGGNILEGVENTKASRPDVE